MVAIQKQLKLMYSVHFKIKGSIMIFFTPAHRDQIVGILLVKTETAYCQNAF